MRYLTIIGGILLASCAANPHASMHVASAAAPATQIQQRDAVRMAIKSGYHATGTGDDKLYCRERIKTGTHLAENACYTPDQLVLMAAVRQEAQDMLNVPERCSGGPMCNGGAAAHGGAGK